MMLRQRVKSYLMRQFGRKQSAVMTIREVINDECRRRRLPLIIAEAVMAWLETVNKKTKYRWDDSIDGYTMMEASILRMRFRQAFDDIETVIWRVGKWIETDKPTADNDTAEYL